MYSRRVVLSGFVSGVSVALWAQLAEEGARSPIWAIVGLAALAGLAGVVTLVVLRFVLQRLVRRIPMPDAVRGRYARQEASTYLAFLVTVLTAVGLQLITPVVLGVVAVFVAAQVALLRPDWDGSVPDSIIVAALFLLSGSAAMIYQIVWQRVLFRALGVNMEAVTLVVSIFMLGLGLGALVGGRLSTRYAERLPLVFGVIELGIAAFAAVSVPLLSAAGDLVVSAPLPVVAMTLVALLLVPTLLMGTTLPVLVAHVNRSFADVGRSVGTLYFVNTVGSPGTELEFAL